MFVWIYKEIKKQTKLLTNIPSLSILYNCKQSLAHQSVTLAQTLPKTS